MDTVQAAETGFVGREAELSQLEEFIRRPGSGLTFLRGRRRVGKTWLLTRLRAKLAAEQSVFCFYYMGTRDADDEHERRDFALAWSNQTGDTRLAELAHSYRTWHRILSEVTAFASEQRDRIVVLIFDEIQWMATKGSSLTSRIKELWVAWQQCQNVKVILCGSSSRFFETKAHASDAVLRGVKTRASIWVHEFTPREIARYYLSQWQPQEALLTYMLLGGVPYYYSTLRPDLGFIRAINQAMFCQDSIFLEEIDELLNLEFNRRRVETTKKILAALGQQGTTLSRIASATGLPSSTVSEALDDLVQFDIAYERAPIGSTKRSRQGVRYYMRDFYLNTYFQLLAPFSQIIRHNADQLIFPAHLLRCAAGYFIANFSGHAFELLIETQLRRGQLSDHLHRELSLTDHNFTVGTYWDKQQQIDLVVESPSDRIARIIECKWVNQSANLRHAVEQTRAKGYSAPQGFSLRHFVATAVAIPDRIRRAASRVGVSFIDVSKLVK